MPLRALLFLLSSLATAIFAESTTEETRSNGHSHGVLRFDDGDNFFERIRNGYFKDKLLEKKKKHHDDDEENADGQTTGEDNADDKELTDEEKKEREHKKELRERLKEKHRKNKQRLEEKRQRRRNAQAQSSSTPDPVFVPSSTWDGGSTTDSGWTSAANWDSGGLPEVGDVLKFGGTLRLDPHNDMDQAASIYSGIVFNAGAGPFVISGNQIKLTGSIINNSLKAQKIGLTKIVLDGNITVGTSAAGTQAPGDPFPDLFLNSDIDLNGATRTFTGVVSTGQVHFGGAISGGSNGVTFATPFTASGAYVPFIFDGSTANTYTGLTTVGNGAFLVFEGATSNGAVQGNVRIEGNGVVDYLGGDSQQIANNATVTVNSQGNTIGSGGNSIFSGLDLYEARGTETIGALSGNGTVGLSDSTLEVGEGNFTGVIRDGTHTRPVDPLDPNGARINLVGGKLTKYGSGVLTLSGANTFTGGMTLSAGTLRINNAKAIGTGAFTIAGGTIDNTTASAITLANNNAQNWNGSFTFTGTRALNLGTGTVTIGNSLSLTVNGTAALTVGGAISGGAVSLTKLGTGTLVLNGAVGMAGSVIVNAGTLTLAGANSYSGGTSLATGTLNINSATALGTGTLTIASGTIDNTSAGSITLNNTPQSWAGSFTFAGTQSLNLGTGSVSLGGNRTVTVTAKTLTVGGVISGAGGLTKAGAGTMVLGGANAYAGATTVNAGNLQVGVGGAGNTGMGGTTVAAGATLSGTGAASTTVLNGTLKPGDNGGADEGTLTITGNLTATGPNSALVFDITNPTGTWAEYVAAHPGDIDPTRTGNANDDLNTVTTDQGDYNSRIALLANFYKDTDPTAGAHDKLKVQGTFTIDGNTTITVNNLGAQANLVAGQVFNIIDATTFVTAGFSTGGDERGGGSLLGNLFLPSLGASFLWDTTKFLSDGILIVVDPPVYWAGGATGGADPTSWTEAGNWVREDGSAAVAPDATARVIISNSGDASHQNAMQLDHDLTIRELVINGASDTSLSGVGTLKIAPVVDNGEDHDAITVNGGAGTAKINTGLSLSQGARITVNNVDDDTGGRGLVLTGQVSAKKKLIKSGPGRLTFQEATMAIGGLHSASAETLNIQFEGTGGITMQDTTLQFDLFSHGSADKINFIGSLEGGNDVLLEDAHFEVAAAEGTALKDGASWDILDWSNLAALDIRFTGDIANFFNLPTLGEGQSWSFDRFASEGVIYVTPEPSRAMLLFVAFSLMHLRRRRR